MFAPVIKAFVGMGLVSAGTWTLVGGYINNPGIDAVVNAQPISLRAASDGLIHYAVVPGSRVGPSAPLYSLAVGRSERSDRQAGPGASSAKAQLAALRGEVDDLTRMYQELNRQSEQYRTARVHQLESRLAEMKAGLGSAVESEREAVSTNTRQRILFEKGWMSASAIETSDSTRARARLDRQAIESRLNTLTIELAAARQGTYVGDGFNDTSYSKQRADDLALRLSEKKGELAREAAAVDLATKRSASSEPANDHDGTTTVAVQSANDAIVWKVPTSQDQFVKSGEPVLELADCSRLFLSVEVTDTSYAKIRQGNAVTFRTADDDREYRGRIVLASSASSSASGFYTGILDSTKVDGAKLAFVIGLDDSVQLRQLCPAGRIGKVVFNDSPPVVANLVTMVRVTATTVLDRAGSLTDSARGWWRAI